MRGRTFSILGLVLFVGGFALVIWARHGGSPVVDAATGQVAEIAQGRFATPIYVTPLHADLNIAGIVAILVGVALAALPASVGRRRK